tara:strand:- start:11 stop:265 length:255 start_codon:yes stop_codon:yes gene_type:complete
LAAIKDAPSTIVSAEADADDAPNINASDPLTRTIEADAVDAALTVAEETRFLKADADALDVPEIVAPTEEVLNALAATWLFAVI